MALRCVCIQKVAVAALGATLIGCGRMHSPGVNDKPPVVLSQAPVTPAPATPLTDRFAVPVLMYHRVAWLTEREKRSPLLQDLTVSPADFEMQVKYLVDNRFTFLLARDVEEAVREGRSLPERSVVLTMDDGYKDNFEEAFPILRKYRVPATIFLVTSTVDSAGHLAWDEVRMMQVRGVGYGSHTVTHPELPTLSLEQMDYELRVSKRTLEDRLLERITAVAYPSGAYNRTVTARTQAAGYLAGWKKGGGPVQPGMDLYLLPRVRVNGGHTLRDFRRKVWSGVYVLRDRNERVALRRSRRGTYRSG